MISKCALLQLTYAMNILEYFLKTPIVIEPEPKFSIP